MIYTSYQPVLRCFLHQIAWELLLSGCMLKNPKWSSNLEPFTATTFITHCAGWQNKWILIYQYFYRLCTDLHTPALAHILTCARLYSPADKLRSYLLPFTFTGNHSHTHTSTRTCRQSLKFGLISTNLPSPAFMFILLYLMLTRRYVHSHPLSRTDA